MSSRDPRTWMWAEACELLSQADRLHRQFFRPAERSSALPQWEPPVDMVEFADGVLVTVALPGVRGEDVRISLSAETGSVLVSAQRLGPANLSSDGSSGGPGPSSRTVIRRLEIPYGRFERRISLPVGRYRLHQQELANGCLELRFLRF